jgi:hypothetical protein
MNYGRARAVLSLVFYEPDSINKANKLAWHEHSTRQSPEQLRAGDQDPTDYQGAAGSHQQQVPHPIISG